MQHRLNKLDNQLEISDDSTKCMHSSNWSTLGAGLPRSLLGLLSIPNNYEGKQTKKNPEGAEMQSYCYVVVQITGNRGTYLQ